MNDVRAKNKQFLKTANELLTINKPLLQLINELYSINKLSAMSQRYLQSMNQLLTFNEPLVKNDRYQIIIIIIRFPSFKTSDSLIESQRQLSFAKSMNNSYKMAGIRLYTIVWYPSLFTSGSLIESERSN